MPAAIGGLLLAGIPGITGLGTLATSTIFGVSIGSLVGSAVLGGALIGLQALIAPKPKIPKPEDGQQSLRQAIPIRRGAYGRVRISGAYMCYEVKEGASYDILALISGKIGGFVQHYLHDDPVTVVGGVVQEDANNHYGQNRIFIDTRLGSVPETPYATFIDELSEVWSEDHRGDGIASASLICRPTKNEDFLKVYPNQLPELSSVIDAYPVWDPRDSSQSRAAPSTWTVSTNPVLQLLDYLTNADHGGGEYDYALSIEPVIDDWVDEANLCDALVAKIGGTQKRYESAGFFQFDNKPEEVMGAMLSACDGWLAENGDGTIGVTVGVYRAPTVTIEERHKLALNIKYGVADEEAVNELTLSFTSAAHHYRETAIDPWRDEESISLLGRTRPQALSMVWVPNHPQARRLAKRAMQRLNPTITGTITTTLYGMAALGQRWIRLQLAEFYAGLSDAVVEVQKATVDLQAGRVTIDFVQVNPSTIDAWNPATEEGDAPTVVSSIVGAAAFMPVIVSTTGVGDPPFHIDIVWQDPQRPEWTWIVRYRLADAGDGNPGAWVEEYVSTPTDLGDELMASIFPATEDDYEVQIAAIGSKGTQTEWSEPLFVSLAEISLDFSKPETSGYLALLEDI